MPQEFERYLDRIEFRGKQKTHYTDLEKMELLKKAAPLILGGTPIQMVAAMIVVPYETLYIWVKKVNTEGLGSIPNKKDKKTKESHEEMFKAVEWIKVSGRRPTPSMFNRAVYFLRLKRKPITLYLYYRRYITKKEDE